MDMILIDSFEIESNIYDVLDGDIGTLDNWEKDFEDELEEINQFNYRLPDNSLLTMKIGIFGVEYKRFDMELRTMYESNVKKIAEDKELQNKIDQWIRSSLVEFNDKLEKLPLATTPNAYYKYENGSYFVELYPGQKEVSIEYLTLQVYPDSFEQLDWDIIAY